MIYSLKYDGQDIARVEVSDHKATLDAIKDMVEFWAFWEKRLAEAHGDYTLCWLHELANFMLYEQRPPNSGDEGWYLLDGSLGIRLISFYPWQFDPSAIEVTPES